MYRLLEHMNKIKRLLLASFLASVLGVGPMFAPMPISLLAQTILILTWVVLVPLIPFCAGFWTRSNGGRAVESALNGFLVNVSYSMPVLGVVMWAIFFCRDARCFGAGCGTLPGPPCPEYTMIGLMALGIIWLAGILFSLVGYILHAAALRLIHSLPKKK